MTFELLHSCTWTPLLAITLFFHSFPASFSMLCFSFFNQISSALFLCVTGDMLILLQYVFKISYFVIAIARLIFLFYVKINNISWLPSLSVFRWFLQEIQSLLTNWKGPDLIGYGELVLEGTFRLQRAKNERTLFLFDKLLLITKKREETYTYKAHILVGHAARSTTMFQFCPVTVFLTRLPVFCSAVTWCWWKLFLKNHWVSVCFTTRIPNFSTRSRYSNIA